jgi:hypothetical protein
MKASELRIGNWLYSHISERYFQVDANDILNIDEAHDEGMVVPIELTEVILFKIGSYLNKHDRAVYELGAFSFMKREKSGWIVWHRGHALGIVLKYVHQLQNLHFALIGEELTANIDKS